MIKKIIVIGLGNPILGDDGVGWRVAEALQKRLGTTPDVEVDCLSLGGLSLMERLIGYRRAIIIDSMDSGLPLGTVRSFPLETLPNPNMGHSASAHDVTLKSALELGHRLGADLPQEVLIVAVEAWNVYDFSDDLSPEVSAAVPKAVQTVIGLLDSTDMPGSAV